MKKVILDYDEASGNLYDKNGMFVFSFLGLVHEDIPTPSTDNLSVLKEIKAMGIPLENLKELRELGLI